MKAFCSEQGLDHQFSSPYVPPQNGVVERKNRTLVEMARTMLDEHKTPRRFWAEAINTACYVANRIFLRAFLGKTSYELRYGRCPKVSHFRVFGCKCFILKKGNLDKFESRSSDGLFLGYALQGRAYRVLNLDTNRIEETCEVTFDETMPCFSSAFECAGDDEIGQNIFEDEVDGLDDDDDATEDPAVLEATPIQTPSSTIDDGPSELFTSTADPAAIPTVDHEPATIEGEATSVRTAPRHIQRRHPPRAWYARLKTFLLENGFSIQHITLGTIHSTIDDVMMLRFGFVYTDLCFRHGSLSWLLTACPSRRCCVCHGFVFHGIDLIQAFAVNFDWKLCYPSCELAICLVFSLVLALNLFAWSD